MFMNISKQGRNNSVIQSVSHSRLLPVPPNRIKSSLGSMGMVGRIQNIPSGCSSCGGR